MSTTIRELLDDEIVAQIENLGKLENGSDAKKAAIEQMATLYKLRIEESKACAEAENRDEQVKCHLAEEHLKEAQLKEQIRDRRWKNGQMIGSTALFAALAVWGMKFETTGTFTLPSVRKMFESCARFIRK